MRRLRALAVGLGVVLGLGVPIAGVPGSSGPTLACAAEGGPRAVLVVDDGASVQRLCVALDATTVSGIRLVELAGAQHGLSYSLGYGKQAVCQLNGVGPAGGDCFAAYPEFWGYWHGNGSGGWTWASGGAATFRVGDGDVEGWVWGTGDTGSAHRAPPTTHADDVCPPPPPPSPSGGPEPDPGQTGDGGDGGGASGDGAGGGAGTASDAGSSSSSATSGDTDDRSREDRERSDVRERDERDDRDRDAREDRAEPTVTPTPDDGETDLRATGATIPDGGGGPPAALLAAVALGLALGAAGWWRARRHPAVSRP